MTTINCADIVNAVNGKLIFGDANTFVSSVCTDSRKIENGCLFVPIVGANFDGHTFINSAIEQGANAVLVEKEKMDLVDGKVSEKAAVIQVENTLNALGAIAKMYRNSFELLLVGITGSVGKTTTKEMISCVMSQKYNVLKTAGNFNNEIGLPLTLFRLEEKNDAAVIEMGMSALGEIDRLTKIAQPQIAVITNVGTSHIETLGSRENILKAKLEIINGLDENGVAVINVDDNLLAGAIPFIKNRTITFGFDENANIQASNAVIYENSRIVFDVKINGITEKVLVPTLGLHNVYNALAAIAVGLEAKIPLSDIIKGIAEYKSDELRLNIVHTNSGFTIINDCYNASPQSMKAAIAVLSDYKSDGSKYAVLGDMLELGEWTQTSHKKIGAVVGKQKINYLICVGTNSEYTKAGAVEEGMPIHNIKCFETNAQATDFLKANIKNCDVILIKGSRGAKMEEIYKALIEG